MVLHDACIMVPPRPLARGRLGSEISPAAEIISDSESVHRPVAMHAWHMMARARAVTGALL